MIFLKLLTATYSISFNKVYFTLSNLKILVYSCLFPTAVGECLLTVYYQIATRALKIEHVPQK